VIISSPQNFTHRRRNLAVDAKRFQLGLSLKRSHDCRPDLFQLTEKGCRQGLSKGTPRLVSTKDTVPPMNFMIAISPGAPVCSVPSLGARSMMCAGFIVALAMTSSRE